MPTGDALEEIPRVGGTTATAAGDATPKLSSLVGGTKAMSKVPAGVSVAAKLANLLPSANAELAPVSEGVYVGDGLPPVPAKLAAKIRKGEFVEMRELLPEFWSSHREEDMEGKQEIKIRRSRKVTDIFTWLQCFGSYVSVRTQHTPSLIPELMAYMAAIVRVSQDYAGLAWVRYDAAYRRQAALTGNTHWSTINSTLYTICFTGRAMATPRCELCFATTHSTSECAQQGDPDPGIQDHLKAIEMAVLAMTSESQATLGTNPKLLIRQDVQRAMPEVEQQQLHLSTVPIQPCVQQLWGKPSGNSLFHSPTLFRPGCVPRDSSVKQTLFDRGEAILNTKDKSLEGQRKTMSI